MRNTSVKLKKTAEKKLLRPENDIFILDIYCVAPVIQGSLKESTFYGNSISLRF